MPESRIRRRRAFTAPAQRSTGNRPSPRWFAIVMVALLVIGLIWVVVYYLTQTRYPISGIGDWNLVVGFGVLLLGFGMLTRWR